MKIDIAEVVVTKKSIEIPDVCPDCKTDLKGPGAINVQEYIAYQWSGVSWNGEKLVWDQGPKCGEAELSADSDDRTGWTYVECAGCATVLSDTFKETGT
jgi:hypothetical protein